MRLCGCANFPEPTLDENRLYNMTYVNSFKGIYQITMYKPSIDRCHEKTCLCICENKGADQLISAIVIAT